MILFLLYIKFENIIIKVYIIIRKHVICWRLDVDIGMKMTNNFFPYIIQAVA